MMLGEGDSSSALLASSSSDANAIAVASIGGAQDGGAAASDVGGGGSNNSATEEDKAGRNDDGDRSFGGNRWPRQETLALLKIRSDMDQVFRDSSLKGPLWEEISRKLAELGYNRSAKKCKEKFENVYKYHRRTKDGRTGKPEGKHYKFFDQLEALDHHHHHHSIAPQATTKPQAPLMQAIPWTMNPPSSVPAHIKNVVTSISAANPIQAVPQSTVIAPPTNPTVSAAAAPPLAQPVNNLPYSFANVSPNLFSSSTSSSTASEEYSEERPTGTRKRKWKMFFKRLTKQVIKKQEELQYRFLEEMERRERERIVRDEAWRVQEMARIDREHEILIQERATAAAKDAAVIAFLQNISGQQQIPVKENPQPPPPTVVVQPVPAVPPQPQPPATTTPNNKPAANNNNYGGNVVMSTSSSRWPKAEVQALIKFRTELANKYQENGPKGPLWEEIAAAMRSVGYNRNAKRCKEKWENINKYFKKVKESNKKRPDDSKTCPYFDQLDALYREKSNKSSENNSGCYGNVKAVNHNTAPLMVLPEQQWPLHNNDHLQGQNQPPLNVNQIQEDDEEEEEEEEGNSEEGDEEEEEEEGNEGYEIVPNKAAAAAAASMGNAE
ncbi:trihelix transcription factor DF1 [Citrus sinensis]|uniref:trihelix transcription factor DF1-like n=1 Tax=Citrus sinensis TaxID=2711 RepID=UPI0021931D67|nr:trihelix transcription factor DF1-like [Citrus sinensis]KAH9691705.1 trihelix transcription factor DF1 [Citrus sinensis]